MLGAAWFALLWFGAPRLEPSEDRAARLADRARNAVILGVAIPFVLGFSHALYGVTCLAAAVLCVALAWRSAARAADAAGAAALRLDWWPTIVVAAVALAVWPQLVRPPLDGDTLAYHVPNASSWVQSHSLWIARTRYWWYPGGSELFAAGLMAVGARWSLPLAGAAAAVLAALRLTAWYSRGGSSVGALIGAAFVTMTIAAPQVGSLQNDLWLAAALLEVLWVMVYSRSSRATIASLALCALVKPIGPIVALIGAVSYLAATLLLTRGQTPIPERSIDVAGGFIPFGLWIARDVLLDRVAVIPIAATAVPDPFRTTIAGHGWAGLVLLGHRLLEAGPSALVLALTPWVAAAVFIARAVRGSLPFDAETTAWGSLCFAGVLASVLYVFAPFGFAGSVPQLASGASLRFDLPSMVCGAALLVMAARHAPAVVGVPSLLAAAFGAVGVQWAFWNDALTRTCVPVTALGVALVWLALRWRSVWTVGAACVYAVAALCFGGSLAAGRAVAFYDAQMRAVPSGTPTKLFSALQRLRPRAAVALDVRAGMIAMVSPRTAVFDDVDSDPCGEARRESAVLVVGTDPDVPAFVREQRRAMALTRCGRVIYQDAAAVIAAPSSASPLLPSALPLSDSRAAP